MFIKDIYLCVFLTKCTGLPSHFLVGVWPDSYARRRAHCLVISGELISLQEQLHTYITSWLKQGLALLRPVNPSLQLRRPQRHAPTTTPLPLPKRRASLCRSQHHINYQTLRVHTWCMAVLPHPPSCFTNSRGVRHLRQPECQAPTTTPLHPLPLTKRWARFMAVKT